MFNSIKKNLYPYCAFGVLCALLTLLPVIRYSLSSPKELVVTIAAWFLSNLVICTGLFCYSRRHSLIKRFLVRKSHTEMCETHLIRQTTSESALQR
ncbi:MAG: hypothetical protein DYG89_27535 [Caldilinea sp. CFX5]|nr:hypothetical protein [Caldilinea sp. CFX5]